MAKSKKFGFRFGNRTRPLAEGFGGCIATDMVTVDALRVGYMYRDEPHDEQDSGWVLTSGRESPDYMDDPDNHTIFDVNTIANYDEEIIPFLGAPPRCAFERQGRSGKFVQVEGDPWNPGDPPHKHWPPPGFPLVNGQYALTETWSIKLPSEFTRRVDDGSLVLWRPGLTIWLANWINESGSSQAERLSQIKNSASKERFAERETTDKKLTRYSYRLRDESEDGPVESLTAFIIADGEHLQIAIYFDDPADEATATEVASSITHRPPK